MLTLTKSQQCGGMEMKSAGIGLGIWNSRKRCRTQLYTADISVFLDNAAVIAPVCPHHYLL